MSNIPELPSQLPRNGNGYNYAMESLDNYSPASKIVNEELNEFFKRTQERLNQLVKYASATPSELSKEIREIISYRLGFPTAKSVTTIKRSNNGWNNYQANHYDAMKTELGTIPFNTLTKIACRREVSRAQHCNASLVTGLAPTSRGGKEM